VTMTAPIIRFDDVSKTFERPDGRGSFVAVERLSFDIAPGEIVAVLGKTGCGKSTMFNIVAGLIEPSSGKAVVDGHEPFRDFAYFRGKIGIVFQGDRLMPWRSALDNVLLGLQILDSDTKQARDTAMRWLARLGLSGHENDYPHALSGGMRQRVSIARAFANDPDILLMDEPFSALDEQNKILLQEELLRIWEETRKTVMFITHSVDEAVTLGDRIMIMTAHPGRSKLIVDVPFERPRKVLELRAQPEYGELVYSIWGHLRDEVQRARAQDEGKAK